MNDLEICKRIAEIEGKYIECDLPSSVVIHNGGDGKEYNPLTDDGLCFRLMVKYGLTFNDENDMYGVASCKYSDEYLCVNESPNKAICLAIIAAHKDV